ncbi:MAG: hypothetical protein IPL26_07990 [Leptospiraceae bacterium]|nr:hypothetical protein [Leptospiraceae bacterium]
MEEKIFNSQDHEDYYDSEKDLIRSVWFSRADISENLHKQEFISYFNCVRQYKPKYIIVDTKKANREISIETQSWIAKNYFPIYTEIGLKNLAILLSENAMLAFSILQTVESAVKDSETWETKYFADEKVAIEWMFGN